MKKIFLIKINLTLLNQKKSENNFMLKKLKSDHEIFSNFYEELKNGKAF